MVSDPNEDNFTRQPRAKERRKSDQSEGPIFGEQTIALGHPANIAVTVTRLVFLNITICVYPGTSRDTVATAIDDSCSHEDMEKFLRSWRQDALNRGQHDAAVYIGDKVLALSSTSFNPLQ